ncbi:TA system VapC family ribonuclease toxin [Microlunatus elymi]|uniref:TA system VapC family ribonuclease toxin n=1 Tax=Microlunatus elymi TaxID=2596828 RepID=UPI00143DFF27|nr:TA system VapC family ribonuclease toxin [Microlunatus elymi]
MIIPDANLLLYAYDLESPFHESSKQWWENTLSGTDRVGLTHPVIFAFLRIATSSRVYRDPMSVADAASSIRSWTSRNVTEILRPGPEHHETVVELLIGAGSSGANLVTDAQIAALALEHGGVVHTADTDFGRFPKLRTAYPLKQ